MTENANETQGTEERFLERDGEKIIVPENFWDSENNTPDTFAIMKSQADLRKQIGEDLSPKDGVYSINIPEEMKDKLQADPEDPLYKEFCKIAKAKRMSQEDFDSITKVYYKKLYDAATEFDNEDYMQRESEALKQKFGNKLDKVKTRIDNFVQNSGITDQDMLNEIQFMQTSAAGVAVLDYLLSLRDQPMPTDTPGKAGQLSLAELRAMMSKPEYTTDTALQEKVRKGFEALYPD